jgi:hypothetical protein
MKRVDITQVAYSTPFDNSMNGFLADDVQEAIEEIDSKVTGKPRAIIAFAYNGTANSGKWLETFASIASNETPFVTAEPAKVKALSLVNFGSTTATVTLYKNGVSAQTISLAAQTYKTIDSLTIALATGDSLSAQVTSGSMQKPALFVSIEINL